MNSQARRLRRKSVLRSVLSVHAAYRAVPFRPARMASLCSAPRMASACSRFRVLGVVIRSPFPAYSFAFPPSFRSSASDPPPASGSFPRIGSLPLCGSLSRPGALSPFAFAPAILCVCRLKRAGRVETPHLLPGKISCRACAFFRFLLLSSRYGNKFHIFPPCFDEKNSAAIVQ